MSDLQQYLDQALSQIKLSDTDEEAYLEEYDIEVELRELIFLDRTLKNLKPGILTCIGHCADAYRLWLFQYKSAYVLLGDLGNGNYSFYKEVKDPADVPVDS